MQAISFYPHSPDDVLAHLASMPSVLPKSADVVIIGGGIMGASSAYYLARAGMNVVLLEKDKVASQQSGRNWGFVRTQYRDPAELPLAIEALSLWPGLERELGRSVGWRKNGCLFVAENEAEQETFEHWHKETKGLARNARIMSGHEVAALVPGLRTSVLSALYTHSDGQAEPVLATMAFARAAESLGAHVIEDCGVVEIDVAGGAITGVVTEYGPIRAAAVICAVGAASHRLLRKLRFVVPQQVVRSTVSLTASLPEISPACFVGFGLGLRQRTDGSCIIAADSVSDIDLTVDSFRSLRFFLSSFLTYRKTFSLAFGRPFFDDMSNRLSMNTNERIIEPRRPRILPNHKRASMTARLLQRLFSLPEQIPIVKSWAGCIDVLPDALPVIDAPSGVTGLVVATGFSGHGFGVGPAVGRISADLATGARPSIELDPFRLERFERGTYGRPHAPL